MGKRVALLIDSEKSLLKIREAMELLYEAKTQGGIIWTSSYICDICKDPKGLDDILQEYTQSGIDVVVVISVSDYSGIIISSLRHKFGDKRICVVPITLGQSDLDSTKIFQDIISGNLPEMEYAEFEKSKRLAPYEIMRLL